MTGRRKQIILIASLMVALAITLIFSVRLADRLTRRPLREPIQPWMSVPHIARANQVPPEELFKALGLPATRPPDLRPIAEIARAQNRSVRELISILEERIQRGPPDPPDPDRSQ